MLILLQKDYWMQQQQTASEGLPRCLTCPMGANVFNDLDVDTAAIDYEVLVDLQMGYSPIDVWHTLINSIDTALIREVTG